MGKFWNILSIARIVIELIMQAKAKKDADRPQPDTESGQ